MELIVFSLKYFSRRDLIYNNDDSLYFFCLVEKDKGEKLDKFEKMKKNVKELIGNQVDEFKQVNDCGFDSIKIPSIFPS